MARFDDPNAGNPKPETVQEPDGVAFASFAGLRNTVGLERLGPRELARATNIDLDDAGQVHRRRGYSRRLIGRFHSAFRSAHAEATLAVKDGVLSHILPDWSVEPLMYVGVNPLAYVEVGGIVYFSSETASGQIEMSSMTVGPWCANVDPSYQPSLVASQTADFWLSPIAVTEDTLGAVGGRLLGPPPRATALALYNGRVYLAVGSTLWATELYLYNFVDKNKSYRQFEEPITAIGAVDDGIYVGTTRALYFISGTYQEHVRLTKETSGCIPGSLIQVPGEMVIPEARIRPDIPHETSKAIAVMTHAGMVIGMKGGQTFNLTRASFLFPRAVRGAGLFREQDGMNTMIQSLDSGGTPTDNARIGDYIDATIIRNGSILPDADQPNPLPDPGPTDRPGPSVNITFEDVHGNVLLQD